MSAPFPLLSTLLSSSNMATSLRSMSVAAYPPSPDEGTRTTFLELSAPPHAAPTEWNTVTVLASASASATRGWPQWASTPLLLRSYSLRVKPSTR